VTVTSEAAAVVGVFEAGDLAGLRTRLHDLLAGGVAAIDVDLGRTARPTVTCWAMLVDVTRRARDAGGDVRIRISSAEAAGDVSRLGLAKVLTVRF
jgi:hypothetical protein